MRLDSTVATTAALLFVFGAQSLLAPAAEAEDLKVANGWVSLPIGREDPPAYFVIQNRGGEPRTIVGASSACCERVALRRATVRDGQMASDALGEMTIPAGGAVAFAPRGLFLRLMSPGPLAVDQKLAIELELANGEKVAFEAVVKDE